MFVAKGKMLNDVFGNTTANEEEKVREVGENLD
jgi:hypothetical protein